MNTHISYAPKFEPWDSSHWSILVLHPQGPDLSMEPWIETVHLNPPRQWNHVESFGQTKLKRFHDQYQKGCFQHIGCLRKRKKHCRAKCWCPTETMKKVLDLLDLRSNRGVLYRTQRILSKLSSRQVVWHACTWIQRLQIAFKLSTCELLPVFFSSPSPHFPNEKEHPPPHMGTHFYTCVFKLYKERTSPMSPFCHGGLSASCPITPSSHACPGASACGCRKPCK